MAGNNGLANEEIRQITPFLNANGITKRDPKTKGWYDLMVQNDVRTALITVLQNENIIEYCQETYGGNRVPAYDRVLHAFTLVRPEEVKVLVIGTSPAIIVGKAGGVAFSNPDRRDPGAGENQYHGAVKKFRDALEEGLGNNRERLRGMGLDEYSFDLKYWARENKVLLLNAGLTMTGEGENPQYIRENCDLWESFMTRLLRAWRDLRERIDELANQMNRADLEDGDGQEEDAGERIHVLLLGYRNPDFQDTNPNFAEIVWGNNERLFRIQNCHHPTYPQKYNNFPINAREFFQQAFPPN